MMIKKSDQMRNEIRSEMRGGIGEINLVHILEKEDMKGKARLCALMQIPVGGSIGEHLHDPDAEIYLVISGTAQLDSDGELSILNAGDAVFTGPAESHSVRNVGDTTLEIIGIIIN
jgi:mannose-6-phosphate isomerase-like protein (cupin superfamily)